MRIGHLGLVAFSAFGLSACGFLPASQQQEITVSSAVSTDEGKADSTINAQLAQLACAEGYEKISEKTVPADPGSFEVWQVRCLPLPPAYYPDFKSNPFNP